MWFLDQKNIWGFSEKSYDLLDTEDSLEINKIT